MNKIALFFAILFLCSESIVYAMTIATPEMEDLGAIGSVMNMYKLDHPGQILMTWEQITEIKPLSRIDYLKDHYQFITQPMSVPDEEGSQVLLIRTVPLMHQNSPYFENGKKNRYLVYRRKNGEISFYEMPEDKVQAMLQKAGVTITPKPGLPAVEDADMKIPMPPRHLLPNPTLSQLQALNATDQQAIQSASEPATAIPAETTSVTETSIPFWIYGVILLSIGCIVGIGFLFLREKK